MRVLCPVCGSKAIIGKTNRLSIQVSDLYCSCGDPECGHTFVMNLSYSHTISPAAKQSSEVVRALIGCMPPEQRKQLQQELAL
ncbi:ogr/Delta-like zinc finger family protein [Shewanella sp.]|uniref:ogr/Delta-like zinc finger family protein n=1 Tax=Shewanella sp. TaxID=50422 RepID=UPI003A98110B